MTLCDVTMTTHPAWLVSPKPSCGRSNKGKNTYWKNWQVHILTFQKQECFKGGGQHLAGGVWPLNGVWYGNPFWHHKVWKVEQAEKANDGLYQIFVGVHKNRFFFFAGVHAPFFVIVTQDSVPPATDINECLALPCHNGGTCRNLVGSFQCECAEGFSGKRCKTGRVHGGGGALWGLNTHNPHIHIHTHVSCMLQTWTSACRSPVSTAGPARTDWVPMCVTALKASEASAVNLVRGQPTSISVLLHLFLTCAV